MRHFTSEAINYAWRELAKRAGITLQPNSHTGFESVGIATFYQPAETVAYDSPKLIIEPADETAWGKIVKLPENSLSLMPIERVIPKNYPPIINKPLPILFWGQGNQAKNCPFASMPDSNSLIIHVDILSATLFMLTRWEETLPFKADQHGRFPAHASVAYRQGFLDRPILDEYGIALQAWLSRLMLHWQEVPPQFSVQISHDIDLVTPYTSWQNGMKHITDKLVRQKRISLAGKAIREGVRQIFAPQTTKIWQNIDLLANISETNGLKSHFFFKATSRRGKYDSGYNIRRTYITEKIGQLAKRGHEVGIHPSYDSVDDLALLQTEVANLLAIIPNSKFGGRQHYLRFKMPVTWLNWEKAGLWYDSTLGFPEKVGFRCGTCHPFSPFILKENRSLQLLEIPLIVMDQTLYRYNTLSTKEAFDQTIKLAQKCRQVGGIFTLLWHNTSIDGHWIDWFEMYQRLVAKLGQMQN